MLPRLIAAVALLAPASLTWGLQADPPERTFGQLKPGQQVVEISNDETGLFDSGWAPVIRREATPPIEQATHSAIDSKAAARTDADFVSPNIPDIGLVPSEEVDRMQAEASQAYLDRLAQLQAESVRPVSASQPDTSPTLTPAATPIASESLRAQEDTSSARPLGLRAADREPSALALPQENQPLGAIEPALETEAASELAVARWFEGQGPAVQTMLALGAVILLIYLMAWVFRRMTANAGGVVGLNAGKAPAGILEVLGRYPLGNKQQLVMLKFDKRVLLLAQSPSGRGGVQMTTLCELDEPEDVASVLMKVQDADGTSMNKAFRSAMHRAELGSGEVAPQPSQRVVETKPATQTEVASEVMPGHRDPFEGFGGMPSGVGRRVTSNSEGDRAELWEGKAGAEAASDPVAALRERLDAMRQSGAVNVPNTPRSSREEWVS